MSVLDALFLSQPQKWRIIISQIIKDVIKEIIKNSKVWYKVF